jgi:2-polyprenyl-3-methyl-5-hydroxy-6-metoxy-1,4-benzoquinol methylase
VQQNINTQTYWDDVYRQEVKSGLVGSDRYSRDYGPIHDAIINLIPEGARVLDIACGPGLLCRKIKQRLPKSSVLGIDFSPFMIEQNRHRDQALGIDYQCVDVRGGLDALPAGFDTVTMCEILEHLENPGRVVATAFNLLRPGGRFILTCPHDDSIPDPEHLRTWGHDELFHLLAPYSDTVSFVHFPPPYFHIWMLAYLNKQNGQPKLQEAR